MQVRQCQSNTPDQVAQLLVGQSSARLGQFGKSCVAQFGGEENAPGQFAVCDLSGRPVSNNVVMMVLSQTDNLIQDRLPVVLSFGSDDLDGHAGNHPSERHFIRGVNGSVRTAPDEIAQPV